MVEHDLAARGVTDRRVLAVMADLPRERFVPAAMAELAYDDAPLPIAAGQTISQPFIVAVMAEAAEVTGTDRVLEGGAGSGYGAAVLGRLAAEVWSVERHHVLVAEARANLAGLGIGNVQVGEGDGTLGWPAAAPFDAIVVTAGAPVVPDALGVHLAVGGRLIIPVGAHQPDQQLLRVRRIGGVAVREDLGPVRFVPLVGAAGWPQAENNAGDHGSENARNG